MDVGMKHVNLLIACLYRLEEKVKDRFEECLQYCWLDRALHKMLEEKLFPEWFADPFHYDPLYGRLNGLRDCLALAVRNLILRVDGTQFRYHLDQVSIEVTDHLLKDIPFEKEKAQELANRLNELLLQQMADPDSKWRVNFDLVENR